MLFFQRYWHIVGKDVTRWVLQLLNHMEFPSSGNFTHIVLIPKCSNPENMTHFRPISLSNVVYKIASKTIVNRLKPFMHLIISESQSAFVPSRLISDNVLIAYEISHYMKRSSGEHMAIKLDMSKAYDRIEWSFLHKVMLCVTTVTYAFVLNGGVFGFLTPERGIRQGDPLSPYLFLFVAEALSVMISREESKGFLSGLAVCRGLPKVSHLLFADDTMIFCKANERSAISIKSILQNYEEASGQQVNFEKSCIVFSKNTSEPVKERIRLVLPMEVVDKHGKYLGLPSVVGKSKRQIFANILDKVCSRLHGWKEKWLSRGGKEILIKAVIQAIPSYAMSCFRLPDFFIKDLENKIAKFWWEDANGKGIHWTKWKKLCMSKHFGGLDFRDLETFNTALLAKQLWRLLENSESLLGKIFKARYFPNSNVLGAALGPNPSYTWRSIWGTKNLLEAGLRWRIGDGRSIKIWGDKWLPRESTFQIFTPRGDWPSTTTVSELIDGVSGQWKFDLIKDSFYEEDSKSIMSIPLGSRFNEDRCIWHYNRSGLFSVRSAYHLAIKINYEVDGRPGNSSFARERGVWKWLWDLNIPNKVKIFLWRACKNLLPTRNNLLKRRVSEEDNCAFCESRGEDVMHCLFYCSLSRQIWAMSDVPRSSYLTTTTDMNEWMGEIRTNSETIIVEKCVLLCWQIWNARNKKIFEGDVPNAMDIANLSKKLWSDIHEATIEVLRPRIQRTNEDGRWLPPNHDEVKLNFDAAVNNVDGVCSLGVIARSSTGACLGWLSRRIKQYLDPTSAEAKSGLMAMEMAKIHNWENIILEGDSLVVISAIKDASSSRAEYGNIIADIQRLGASLLKFRAQHVRRNGNKAAHAIVALSKKSSNFVRELPDVVLDIVSSDMS